MMVVSLDRHAGTKDGMRSEAGERGHLMNTCRQRNQLFEIYNQKIEILKKLIGMPSAELGRFF
jgi:hypothetical protein